VERVALSAIPKSPSLQLLLDIPGTWTSEPNQLSNEYFKLLLEETWVLYSAGVYRSSQEPGLYMTEMDLQIKYNADLRAIAQDFATDNSYFLTTFAAAFAKWVNSDRFDGPTGNVCAAATPSDPTNPNVANTSNAWGYVGAVVGGLLVGAGATYFFPKRSDKVALAQQSSFDDDDMRTGFGSGKGSGMYKPPNRI